MRLDYQGTDEELTRKEAAIKAFVALSPRDIDSYIDTEVTDLNSAKRVLKIFGKILLMMAKKVLS